MSLVKLQTVDVDNVRVGGFKLRPHQIKSFLKWQKKDKLSGGMTVYKKKLYYQPENGDAIEYTIVKKEKKVKKSTAKDADGQLSFHVADLKMDKFGLVIGGRKPTKEQTAVLKSWQKSGKIPKKSSGFAIKGTKMSYTTTDGKKFPVGCVAYDSSADTMMGNLRSASGLTFGPKHTALKSAQIKVLNSWLRGDYELNADDDGFEVDGNGDLVYIDTTGKQTKIYTKYRGTSSVDDDAETKSDDDDDEDDDDDDSDDDHDEMVDAIYDTYDEAAAPPAWSRGDWVGKKYNKHAFAIYEKGAKKKHVKMSLERVPVNVKQSRYFDKKSFKKLTGYNRSGYNRYFAKTGKLLPNVPVYTLAPVKRGSKYASVHFIHVFGPAFDDASQPDYEVLLEHMTPKKMVKELIKRYRFIFRSVYETAEKLGLTKICWSSVGSVAFAKMYPGGKKKFVKEVFVPAFEHEFNPIYENLYMGKKKDPAFQSLAKKDIDVECRGLFPDVVDNLDLKKTLLVNAWDPHSMAGNEHNLYSSLDAFVGRNSAVWRLSAFQTNPYILKNKMLVV
jgi:hypothetical protein